MPRNVELQNEKQRLIEAEKRPKLQICLSKMLESRPAQKMSLPIARSSIRRADVEDSIDEAFPLARMESHEASKSQQSLETGSEYQRLPSLRSRQKKKKKKIGLIWGIPSSTDPSINIRGSPSTCRSSTGAASRRCEKTN